MVYQDFRHGQPCPCNRNALEYVPNLENMMRPQSSELRELVERFVSDRAALLRYYDVQGSELNIRRQRDFYKAWEVQLSRLPYDELGVEGRIDWHLLMSRLKYMLYSLEQESIRNSEMALLLPIFEAVAALQEERRQFLPVNPSQVAARLSSMREDLTRAMSLFKTERHPNLNVVLRAVNSMGNLCKVLDDWFDFYNGYDPMFSWWVRAPHRALREAMDDYVSFVRRDVLNAVDEMNEPIVGYPVGRSGLQADLDHELIPYSPEELIVMGERELAWCMEEWKKVAADMGLGDDWREALKRTMGGHLQPGEQPGLIAWQAYEAIDYVLQNDLISVPPLAIDVWRMNMMTPLAQKTNPFFLGGEQLRLSFPTDTMTNEEKQSSLRANNIHVCRCTVHHELIPGHHMQMFSMERNNPHRRFFNTPFWIEGWALWWEFLLWDRGFPVTPENRGGMLFWRTHRCARIVFSLNFHLGKWTPQECIDYLVDTVGHDRHTATGEVRRSFNGNYPPLYQAAYMIGAIQVRALHNELVSGGTMGIKDFHDEFIRGSIMPIEMVRARMKRELLPRDRVSSWRFADNQA